jgi:hypothetical protein
MDPSWAGASVRALVLVLLLLPLLAITTTTTTTTTGQPQALAASNNNNNNNNNDDNNTTLPSILAAQVMGHVETLFITKLTNSSSGMVMEVLHRSANLTDPLTVSPETVYQSLQSTMTPQELHAFAPLATRLLREDFTTFMQAMSPRPARVLDEAESPASRLHRRAASSSSSSSSSSSEDAIIRTHGLATSRKLRRAWLQHGSGKARTFLHHTLKTARAKWSQLAAPRHEKRGSMDADMLEGIAETGTLEWDAMEGDVLDTLIEELNTSSLTGEEDQVEDEEVEDDHRLAKRAPVLTENGASSKDLGGGA